MRASGSAPISAPLYLLSALLSLATLTAAVAFVLTREYGLNASVPQVDAVASLVLAHGARPTDSEKTHQKKKEHTKRDHRHNAVIVLVDVGS